MGGRLEEQALLTRVIEDPEQAGILVAGNAGVGKTRLIREALEAAGGCHAELVTATESARSLPFGAFARSVSPIGPSSPTTRFGREMRTRPSAILGVKS